MPSKSPDLLTPEQRAAFVRIPDDLADREIARYYTFTPDDLAVIKRRRRAANKLGFAVQLAVLRFPGRTITELPSIPARLLAYIAQQVGVDGAIFAHYGMRENTIYEHLDEIRAVFGFRNYDWRAMRQLMRHLLPLAMESDRPIPLIEAALDRLRSMKVIAPGMTTLEQLIVRTLRHGEQRVQQLLLQPLTAEHTAALDALLCAKTGRGRQSRITDLQWLRLPLVSHRRHNWSTSSTGSPFCTASSCRRSIRGCIAIACCSSRGGVDAMGQGRWPASPPRASIPCCSPICMNCGMMGWMPR